MKAHTSVEFSSLGGITQVPEATRESYSCVAGCEPVGGSCHFSKGERIPDVDCTDPKGVQMASSNRKREGCGGPGSTPQMEE